MVALTVMVLTSALALVGCTGEDAVPIDPANPPVLDDEGDLTDVTHLVEPTAQMRELAEQQCHDDPALGQGVVQAVDPQTDEVVSEITVDCSELR